MQTIPRHRSCPGAMYQSMGFVRDDPLGSNIRMCGRSPPQARRTALSGSPSIVEPRTVTTGRCFTRRRPPPEGKSSSRTPMTAAKDNETLDHLLSVVNDELNVRDSLSNCKAARWSLPRSRGLTSSHQFATVRIRHHHSRAFPISCALRTQRAIDDRRSPGLCPGSRHHRGYRRN